eukprot:1587256-Pyramimonas_sp.AAC.1
MAVWSPSESRTSEIISFICFMSSAFLRSSRRCRSTSCRERSALSVSVCVCSCVCVCVRVRETRQRKTFAAGARAMSTTRGWCSEIY